MRRKSRTKSRADCQRHFVRRLSERYGLFLQGGEYETLCADVRNGNGRFLEKESLTRTHWLLNIQGRSVRVVYEKHLSALATALPLPAIVDAMLGTKTAKPVEPPKGVAARADEGGIAQPSSPFSHRGKE